MSKVQSRGEVSPLTAAIVTLLILVVSGLPLLRVVHETTDSLAAPAAQVEPVTVPGSAGSGIHPKPEQSMWSAGVELTLPVMRIDPKRSVEDK